MQSTKKWQHEYCTSLFILVNKVLEKPQAIEKPQATISFFLAGCHVLYSRKRSKKAQKSSLKLARHLIKGEPWSTFIPTSPVLCTDLKADTTP